MTEESFILIQTEPAYVRSAVLKKGELAEFFVENMEHPSQVGAIYKARVIQKRLGSYFVDLGQGQSAFLSISRPKIISAVKTDPIIRKSRKKPANLSIKQGQYTMVQIVKDALKTKNLRVSSKISLPSSHLVYLPQDQTHIGISRQIEDLTLREKLIKSFQKEKESGGWIVRTKAGYPLVKGEESKTDFTLRANSSILKNLKKERDSLKALWLDISRKYRSKKKPGLVYSPLSFGSRLIRDFLTEDIQEIWVDNKTLFSKIKTFMKTHIPKEKHKLKLYQSKTLSLFDKYDLEPELSKLMEKKVKLPTGGFIILEETEAAVVVDVNSGRFRGRKSTEENILKVNLSAAKEITRQLRLRNCGGIVLVDFIDMEKEKSRQKLMETLELLLKKDRAPTNLFPLSEISIAQITRKRERPSLRELLSQPCPHCEGRGHIKLQTSG